MKKFGLIGHPLTHSFSANYFAEKFKKEEITDCCYQLFDIDKIEFINNLIAQHNELIGLNVTIPYKEVVFDYLDEIDPIAKAIGAVNTITIHPTTKRKKGYNTDYYGFKKSLKPFLAIEHERALILGTGGASKAIHYALKELNIDCLFVSRNPKNENEIGYEDINKYVIQHHQLIINTTPVGTYPKVDEQPNLPYELLSDQHLLYDLVYNPSETSFIKKGKENGCITLNGLEMLKLQAEKAWEIWNENQL